MSETNEIKNLMLDLVKIDSVTASPDGEKRAADFIYGWLSKLDYFVSNPENLCRIEVKGKNYYAVSALVRAAKPTNRTVILTGHFDVVDALDCGAIKEWAYDPEEYTKRIADMKINDDARADLESGRYLFGRGVADMKLGIAIEMLMLKQFSEDTSLYDVNILFLAVPDEEGDSFGMRAAVEPLWRMQEQGHEFVVYLNTEPSFVDGEHAASPAVYHGTIGKMMPFFMCVGKETHVGKYSEGLNSLLIASYLNIIAEGRDKRTACLYMRDQRRSYAVTLPERTAVYFNHLYPLSSNTTPARLIETMREDASAALLRALDHFGPDFKNESKWEPRVISASELIELASKREGIDKASLMDRLERELPRELNGEREKNIEVINKLLDKSAEKGPLVVVGFLPPFYPARENETDTQQGRNIERAIGELAEYAGREFSLPVCRAGIMGGITDLSFTGFRGDVKELEPLADNMPLWGRGYEIPLEALTRIDIPVLNLGPLGKDCHKMTERADMEYSLNILPQLLRFLISVL
ncbi:MAG: M20/M25/M40 family metallo-hydrolase [Synergistaceae bacterium]|nr:M20/M25/M40 family metallo-hydrolase [Synergistaceae bacterium]